MSTDDITYSEDYSRFLRHAREHFDRVQRRLRRVLRDHDHHTLRREGLALTLYVRGFPILSSSVVLAGCYDRARSLWRWGWGDREASPVHATVLEDVRAVGESRGFPQLTREVFRAPEDEAWQMASVAALLLDGRGIYCARADGLHSYYVLLDPLSFESAPPPAECEW